MPPREMNFEEKIIRRSIATIQETIEKLCLQRDTLASMLPEAPRPVPLKINPITGKPLSRIMGGGKKQKRKNQ